MRRIDASGLLGWSNDLCAPAVMPGGNVVLAGGAHQAHVVDLAGAVVATLPHCGGVTSVDVAPDGRVVTGSRDMGVRIWSATLGLERLLRGHLHKVNDVAWGPDADHIVSTSLDGSIRAWAADTGEELWSTRRARKDKPRCVVWPGELLLVGCDASVLRLDPSSGDVLHEATCGVLPDVVVSPDAATIVVSSGDGLAVFDARLDLRWTAQGDAVAATSDVVTVARGTHLVAHDASDGSELWSVDAHEGPVACIAALPDGRWISGGADVRVRMWDVDGAPLGAVEVSQVVSTLGFDLGEVVASTAAGVVEIFTLSEFSPAPGAARAEPAATRRFSDGVRQMVASSDGSELAVATPDGFVIVDAKTFETRAEIEHADGARRPVWRGDLLVTNTGERRVGIWRTDTCERIALLDDMRDAVFVDEELLLIATEEGELVLYRTGANGIEEVTRQVARSWPSAISDDARRIFFSGNGSQPAVLYDVPSGEVVADVEVERLRGTVFAPGAERISGSGATASYLWDAEGREIAVLEPTDSRQMVWSPDGGRLAIESPDGRVFLYDRDGAVVAALGEADPRRTDRIVKPRFSPDSSLLVTGGHWRIASAWDAQSGEHAFDFHGHVSNFPVPTFAGLDRIVTWTKASPAGDPTLRLWDYDGRVVATLAGQSGPRFRTMIVSDAGRWIFSAMDDDVPRVWSAEDGTPYGSLDVHEGTVWSATFSSDETSLCSLCDAGVLARWELPLGHM
jgi:WD40 repeat protein